jgi:hypothetical protein
MKFLSQAQSRAIAEDWSRFSSLAPGGSDSDHSVRTHVDVDHLPARRLASLARLLVGLAVNQLPRENECLLLVSETGIWPSSENLPLYYAWRRSKGDTGLLESEPGHSMLPFEHYDCESLVFMCLAFGWGFELHASCSHRTVSCDHDGRVELRGFEPADAARAVQALNAF